MQQIFDSKSRVEYGWLFGPCFDFSFIFAPVLIATLVYLVSRSCFVMQSAVLPLIVAQGFGLGPFHQGATWINYLDKKTRRHYMSSAVGVFQFAVAPLLIMALSIVGMNAAKGIVTSLYMLWTVQHIVQQNVGILLLYHNHNKDEAIPDRTLETRSQHAPAVLFSFLFLQRMVPHCESLGLFWTAVIAVAAVASIWFCAQYVFSMFRQVRAGKRLNSVALLFWLLSVCMLLPFAMLGTDSVSALLIPLIVHWFQYIGLTLVLTKRKYGNDVITDLPLRQPFVVYAATGILMILFTFVDRILQMQSADFSMWQNTIIGFALGLGFIHYWQDSFMWKFREQFNRDNTLRFLLDEKAKHAVSS